MANPTSTRQRGKGPAKKAGQKGKRGERVYVVHLPTACAAL